jgi:hypothetical protein
MADAQRFNPPPTPDRAARMKAWLAPAAALGGVVLFSRGLLVPWLGFYWDDFPTAWAMHVSGPVVMWDFFHSDRPFLPWIYMFTSPLAGTSPLGWQMLGLLAWWLAGLATWWLVRSVWPEHPRLALLTALLFVVYPGFLQGPISLIYTHFVLLTAIFFLSFGCTVRGLGQDRGASAWFVVGLLTQAVALFSFEYLVGLELVRPFLIGIVIWRRGFRGKHLWARSLRTWSPHALVLLGYVVWRAVTPRFPTYEPLLLSNLMSDPGEALLDLATRMGGDVFLSTVGAWYEAASPPSTSTIGRLGWAIAGVSFAGAAIVSFWALRKLAAERSVPTSEIPHGGFAQAMALGGWALLVAGIPVWITLLPLQLTFSWDRMTFPFMLGASLVFASLLLAALGRWRISAAILAAIVAIGASNQALNALTYARAWQDLNTFLAQLTTRAPGIAPGTVVLANDLPLSYYSDNSLTAPLNWIYAPELDSFDVPYMLYFISIRLGLGLPGLEPGLPISQHYRPGGFEGSTSQALVLFFDPPGCLQFLDARFHDSMPGLPAEVSQAVPLSDLSLIDPDPENPAKSAFSPEIDANWCMYFERADLARQQGQWTDVARIGDVALGADDRPNNASEYLPFIEAYGRVGRWEDALHWTQVAMDRNLEVRRMVCNTWRRLDADTQPATTKKKTLEQATSLARCEP